MTLKKNKFTIELVDKTIDKDTCKGLFWRASSSCYVSSHNSIESRKSLRLLKRLSCRGCEKCDWVLDFLKEDINYDPYDRLERCEDGKIYTYEVITSTEWETGHTEIDCIDFKEVKIKEK